MADIVQQGGRTHQAVIRRPYAAHHAVQARQLHDPDAVLVTGVPDHPQVAVRSRDSAIVDGSEEADLLQALKRGGVDEFQQQWVVTGGIGNVVGRRTETVPHLWRRHVELHWQRRRHLECR